MDLDHTMNSQDLLEAGRVVGFIDLAVTRCLVLMDVLTLTLSVHWQVYS